MKQYFFHSILILIFLGLTSISHGKNWEIGIIFLGANETSVFQQDIDQNILELARTQPDSSLQLTVLRDFPTHSMIYQHSLELSTSWDPLFFKIPAPGIKIPGTTIKQKRTATNALIDTSLLQQFMQKSFSNNNVSSRMLIIYGHGLGPEGLQAISLNDLKKQLEISLPQRQNKSPVDILWFDSCFMGNLEALYGFKNLSTYSIASQDAEFSTGMPYDFLELIKNIPTVKETAMILAHRFVESYSFTHLGRQSTARVQSPATISVVENAKLSFLVSELSEMYSELKDQNAISRAFNKLSSVFNMEKENLIDLGSMIHFLYKKAGIKNPKTAMRLQNLSRLLEVNNPRTIKTNPRVRLVSPVKEALLVFGYNNWSEGHQDDTNSLSLIPMELQKDISFIPGPNEKKWPARKVKSRLFISPFSVNLDEFNYYFYDPINKQALSKTQTVIRSQDFYYFASENKDNPVVFRAYTQSVGTNSEKYTGLSIQNPMLAPSMEYLETEFFKETKWTQ